MTAGFAATGYANSALNVLRNTSFSGIASVYVKWHVGDPGSAGTSNASNVTTRSLATFNAASGGSMTLSNSPTYTATSSETLTHISLWTASSGGTFLGSAALSPSRAVTNTQVFTLSTLTISVTPIAA